MSTLSVEISTMVSLARTCVAGLPGPPRIVRLVTDSPAGGATMSIVVASVAASAGWRLPRRVGAIAGRRPGRPPLPPRPRPTLSSSAAPPCWRLAAGGRRDGSVDRDLRQHLADLDRVAWPAWIFLIVPPPARDLGVHLVGRRSDDRLVGRDGLTLLLCYSSTVPWHGTAHLGHGGLDRRVDRHPCQGRLARPSRLRGEVGFSRVKRRQCWRNRAAFWLEDSVPRGRRRHQPSSPSSAPHEERADRWAGPPSWSLVEELELEAVAGDPTRARADAAGPRNRGRRPARCPCRPRRCRGPAPACETTRDPRGPGWPPSRRGEPCANREARRGPGPTLRRPIAQVDDAIVVLDPRRPGIEGDRVPVAPDRRLDGVAGPAGHQYRPQTDEERPLGHPRGPLGRANRRERGDAQHHRAGRRAHGSDPRPSPPSERRG